jgi:hypothetical protein
MMTVVVKRHAVAPDKNREPILGALRQLLPHAGTVLEIASGTGQHAVYFARELPSIVWQPSDVDADAVDSIQAWRAEAALPNLRAPVPIDVTHEDWEVPPAHAIVCINMVHIAPWAACVGLLNGAPRHLIARGRLIFYGPFVIPGRETAPSNVEFDASLRRQNPAWGLRDLGEITRLAEARGLDRTHVIDLPSNNVVAAFQIRA